MKFPIQSCNRLSFSGYILIILSLSAALISTVHFSAFYYQYDQPKWFIFEVSFATVITFLLTQQAQITFGPIAILCIALMYLMFCSLFWASHPLAGVEFIVHCGLAFALVNFIVNAISTEKLPLINNAVISIASLFFVMVFLLERGFSQGSYSIGSFSPIGFVNNLGQVFNIWLPLALVSVFIHKNKTLYKVFFLVLAFVLVFILSEAGTRGSIFGLIIGEVFLFLIVSIAKRKVQYHLLTVSLLLTIAVVVSHFEYGKESRSGVKIENTIAGLIKGDVDKVSSKRLQMYLNTWNMMLDNPIGVGANNFEYIHPYYGQVGTPGASAYLNESNILRTPHNFILKLFSELGLLGGTLCCLLYLVVGCVTLFNAIKGNYIDHGLFIACFALLFHSLLSAVFLTPVSLFFSCLLFASILSRHKRLYPYSWINTKVTLRSSGLKTGVKLLMACVPAFALTKLSSHHLATKGVRQFNEKQLIRAVHIYPGNERAWFDLARVQHDMGRPIEVSLLTLERFLTLYPYHIGASFLRAQWLIEVGKLKESEYQLRRLLEYYPGFDRAKYLLRYVHVLLQKDKLNKD